MTRLISSLHPQDCAWSSSDYAVVLTILMIGQLVNAVLTVGLLRLWPARPALPPRPRPRSFERGSSAPPPYYSAVFDGRDASLVRQ